MNFIQGKYFQAKYDLFHRRSTEQRKDNHFCFVGLVGYVYIDICSEKHNIYLGFSYYVRDSLTGFCVCRCLCVCVGVCVFVSVMCELGVMDTT